ncbi:MAG: hypothetical protein B7Y75_00310, partial [Azorhizobium sp. 35-67-5]
MMISLRTRLLAVTSVLSLAAAFAPPASAQTAASAAAPVNSGGETIDLDAVTVTATRAERPLSDVPQTVRVIERAEI